MSLSLGPPCQAATRQASVALAAGGERGYPGAMSIVGPLRLKAQLMCGDEPAIGPGKALVLDAIERTGSISAAGRDLGMSYRRTWLLVDSLNRCWDERLVATRPGRGGAALTERGRTVLAAFRALEARLEAAAVAGDWPRLIAGLRDRPADPG